MGVITVTHRNRSTRSESGLRGTAVTYLRFTVYLYPLCGYVLRILKLRLFLQALN